MSVKVMTWVWEKSRAKPIDRLILLALADAAADTGELLHYRRSHSHLAEKTGVHPKTVGEAIKRLVDLGELELVERGDGRKQASYRLPMPEGESTTTPQNEPAPLSTPPGVVHDGGRGSPPLPLGESTTPPIIPSLPVDTPSSSLGPSQARGSRIPDPFFVTPEMRSWADEQVPGVDWRRETEKFTNYWRAEAGAKARKCDWVATWRNWMLRADENVRQRAPANGNGKVARNIAAIDEYLASIR